MVAIYLKQMVLGRRWNGLLCIGTNTALFLITCDGLMLAGFQVPTVTFLLFSRTREENNKKKLVNQIKTGSYNQRHRKLELRKFNF